MPTEVYPGIYRIEVPIPNNPLKALNSYVITGGSRPLIVDVGLNREECVEVLRQELQLLNIQPAQADYFLTHLHADHSGAIGVMADASSTVYASRTDAGFINDMSAAAPGWQRMKEYALRNGFPAEEADKAIQGHPGFKYGNRRQIAFTEVSDGTVIQAGPFRFQCIETPGHTRGHVCLYEPHCRILIAGDHILPKITPNISTWTDGENPLAAYLASLAKVEACEAQLVLPGHRWGLDGLQGRIEELRRHHQERNQDILAILKGETLTAYQVASRMRWDLSYRAWDEFPAAQKWFASGEALAHLQYLEGEGLLVREVSETGLIRYRYC